MDMSALPREVLFEVMRTSFRITYKELCEIILSDEPIGGLSPKERGRDAARRNREFIHVMPADDDRYWMLAPHMEYVMALYDRIVFAKGREAGEAAIIETLSGSGACALRASLDACGLDGSIYSNIVNYICDGAQADRISACLLLHLFVATAVSCKPDQSAQEVINTAYSIEDDSVYTNTPPIQTCEAPAQPEGHLALMRCAGKALFPSRTYPLSCDEEGTEVGSVVISTNCITDVERGVSRDHLHIWRDKDGQWWCRGMLSLNGTVLFDISTGETTVVEPPRSERGDGYEPKAFPLKPADKLILAGNTEFIVVSIAV